MRKPIHSQSSTRRGLTLFELLIVLTITMTLVALVVIPADELRGASMTTVTERTMLALRDAIVGSDAQPGYRADVGELPSFVADLFQQPLTLAGTAALPSSGNRLIPSRVAVGAAHIWITLEVATRSPPIAASQISTALRVGPGGGRVVSPDRTAMAAVGRLDRSTAVRAARLGRRERSARNARQCRVSQPASCGDDVVLYVMGVDGAS